MFEKGKTVLGLCLELEVIEELGCLSTSLQKRTETVAGMTSAIDCVRSTVHGKRSEKGFHEVFEKAVAMVDSRGIEPIQIPHQKKPPKQYTSEVSQHTPKSAEEHYRTKFDKMLDSVHIQFEERFNQPDLDVLQKLEETLLTGEVKDVVDQYPELNRECQQFISVTDRCRHVFGSFK